jgi:hypothetical protein
VEGEGEFALDLAAFEDGQFNTVSFAADNLGLELVALPVKQDDFISHLSAEDFEQMLGLIPLEIRDRGFEGVVGEEATGQSAVIRRHARDDREGRNLVELRDGNADGEDDARCGVAVLGMRQAVDQNFTVV